MAIILLSLNILILSAISEEFNISSYNYEEIDRYALSAPSSVETSVKSLASYLTAPAKNEREKARAIYRWTTKNLDYDVEGYFSGSYSNSSPEDLLKSRRSVCEGYAGLFQALAKEAGLTVAKISGYGKGYDYFPGKSFGGPSNHAWNAISINGSWYLLDCTWGAGFVDDNGTFVRQFDNHYFMTPPSEFIFDHFPEDSKWQLLGSPISKSDFESLVYLRSDFFNYGLKIGSHQQGVIETDKEVNITIFVPEDVLLIASLDYKVMLASSARDALENFVFCQRDEDLYSIYAGLPESDSYILRIYAKNKEEPGKYNLVAEYKIDAASNIKKSAGFPYAFGKFIEVDAYLYGPLEGRLTLGESYKFRLKVPGANNVSVINGDRWSYLTRQGSFFEGNAVPFKGDLLVCARFPGKESYDGLLRYNSSL